MPHLSILVIDDDHGDRKLVRRLLLAVRADATVLEAASVDQATRLDAAAPDGIFLDNMLPGQTGLECLAALHAKWPRAAIFLMTSHGDEMIAKSAIQNGATDYIAKNALSRNSVERMLMNGMKAACNAWKLEEQHKELELFSEVLVHDFRAPIRAAAFLSDQIDADLSEGDMAEAREGLRLLRKSSQQMLDMIASLSDHIRLDHEMREEAVPPADLVDRALTALAEEVAQSGAQIRVVVDATLARITCNPPQIAQVLQNLIENAIKYAGGNLPELRIAVLPQDGGGALFELWDNGRGIAPEYRERIFQPFTRVPGSGSVKGTGLGLATCRKMVERHGGRIWCEDGRDGGTVFRFFLPRAGRDTEAGAASRAASPTAEAGLLYAKAAARDETRATEPET